MLTVTCEPPIPPAVPPTAIAYLNQPACVMALLTDQTKLQAVGRRWRSAAARSPASRTSAGMKTIAPAAMAAIEAGEAIVTGAVQITPARRRDRHPRVGRLRPITARRPRLSAARRSRLAQQTAGAIGGVAQGMTLTLSGVEPAALALLDPDEVKGASVVVYRLIFAGRQDAARRARVRARPRRRARHDETIGGRRGDQLCRRERCARPRPQRRADALRSDQRLIIPTTAISRTPPMPARRCCSGAARSRPRTGAGAVSRRRPANFGGP
jgi:hypothetical protein